MRSIQFNEDQLCDVSKLAQSLFQDESDPRSNSYKRILVRPKINWLLFGVWLVCPFILFLVACSLSKLFHYDQDYNLLIITLLIVAYLCCTAKRITVFIIKVYQRFAPDSIRLKCRYEPSCSEYMILSIQKYGLIKGLIKGVKRIYRCNINGGGFDYP